MQQCKLCKKDFIRVINDESIHFTDLIDFNTPDGIGKINYSDDGPGHGITWGLAIAEFDPALLSNMNYKHPDAFKLSVLTSGLEEVRGVLAYQLMQKNLLIVATRQN